MKQKPREFYRISGIPAIVNVIVYVRKSKTKSKDFRTFSERKKSLVGSRQSQNLVVKLHQLNQQVNVAIILNHNVP